MYVKCYNISFSSLIFLPKLYGSICASAPAFRTQWVIVIFKKIWWGPGPTRPQSPYAYASQYIRIHKSIRQPHTTPCHFTLSNCCAKVLIHLVNSEKFNKSLVKITYATYTKCFMTSRTKSLAVSLNVYKILFSLQTLTNGKPSAVIHMHRCK